MTRIMARRTTTLDIAANSDSVIMGVPIPPGGRLNNVWGEMSVIGPSDVTVHDALAYMVGGYVLPVLDPDEVITYDVIWDEQIPKDQVLATGGFDSDTQTADVDPVNEYGEINAEQLVDFEASDVTEFFHRTKILTIANSLSGITQLTGGTPLWLPSDHFKLNSGKRITCPTPMVALIGVSAPNWDRVTTSPDNTPTEREWGWLKYVDMTIEQAFVSLLSITEAGAETPWDDAITFLANMVEAVVYEDTAGDFVSAAWRVIAHATFDISVPGEIGGGTITGGA